VICVPETKQPAPPEDPRRALRRQLRQLRRAIPARERNAAAHCVARLVDQAGLLLPGRRIGLFLSMPEELPTQPLIERAQQRGCKVCLPRILSRQHSRMHFHDAQGPVRIGPYGIAEMTGGVLRRARELDVVFVPLVGFDDQGHRIGMGKGFYDRHFAHRLAFRHMRRPVLIGIAFQVQAVPELSAAPHDVPLDAIVTESSLHWFSKADRR
jgi:5-formyltetrahydrofolate cyclo-ligase